MSNNAYHRITFLNGTRGVSLSLSLSSKGNLRDDLLSSSRRSTPLPRTRGENRATNRRKNEREREREREKEETFVGGKKGDREGRSNARSFRNRIIYSRHGAILGRSIVKLEARLMDPRGWCPRAGRSHGLLRIRPKLMAE